MPFLSALSARGGQASVSKPIVICATAGGEASQKEKRHLTMQESGSEARLKKRSAV